MISATLGNRLNAVRSQRAFRPELLSALEQWIQRSPDEALFRVNPLDWAKERGLDEDEVVDLFLHATHAGILEMGWGMICPGCAMWLTTPGGLRGLNNQGHCRLCRVQFQGTLDDAVEVAFSVAPAVRFLRYHDEAGLSLKQEMLKLFFTPSLNPDAFIDFLLHGIQEDAVVKPGESMRFQVTVKEGDWFDVFAPKAHALTFLVGAQEGPSEVSTEFLDGGSIPEQVTVKAGEVRVTVINRTPFVLPIAVAFLGGTHDSHAAPSFTIRPFLSGKRVLTSSTFSRLFSAQTVDAREGLSLKSLSILFTDLQASTALYERVGDLKALDLVRRHFDVLSERVAAERGTVVKTIGDAVMAAFPDPERAVSAALAMNREMRQTLGDELKLKLGVHAGPCVAIQSNNQIDYFGRTVNLAARVQHLASGGELVCTESAWNAPGVAARVEAAGLKAACESVRLKGIEGEVQVWRIH